MNYIISSNMLAKLKRTGCMCGTLPPHETCDHCLLIEEVKVRHKLLLARKNMPYQTALDTFKEIDRTKS